MIRDCSKCGPTEAVFPEKGKQCQPCVNAWRKANYNKRKSVFLERAKEYRDGNRGQIRARARSRYHTDPEIKQKLDEARLERIKITNEAKAGPCTDCGASWPPEAMDFDHVRGEKTAEVSRMVSAGWPVEKIVVEISKCDLVCACCHRIRTFKRKRGEI